MREMKVKVYTFAELSDAAKVKARDWFRDCESQDFGSFGELYEPAETAAKLLGITFGTQTVQLHGGGKREEPDIRWSGFSSQGDGASFVGTYEYRKGSVKAVKSEFGTDAALLRIAEGLAALQRANGYKLTAKITQDRGSHYVHKYTMGIEAFKGDEEIYEYGKNNDPGPADKLLELMRDFADWIYRGLEAEYEYRLSDEQLDESMIANEYGFTEDGKRCVVIR